MKDPLERILLVDVSNTFTKVAIARNGVIGRVSRIITSGLESSPLLNRLKADRAVVSSVVPKARVLLERRLCQPLLWVDHRNCGISIRYPKPDSIGADRLANAAAAVNMRRLPAIVVDFGTAITFDVIDASACYLGGIIAPGLVTAASALHERTALLPLTQISAITSPVGKSTAEAIRIGLLLGAVGLIRESVARITRDIFDGKKPTVIATGGDAELVRSIALDGVGKNPIFHADPLHTLRGLLVIAEKNG